MAVTYPCTIVGTRKDFSGAIDAIETVSRVKCFFEGERREWRNLEIRGSGGTASLTPLTRVRPGDEFSKMVLSMSNYFSTSQAKVVTQPCREQIQNHIADAELFIGVVISPAAAQDTAIDDAIKAVATAIGGIFFTAHGMLNSAGELLDASKP